MEPEVKFALIDEPASPRLFADRHIIELPTEELDIDFFAAGACVHSEAPAKDEWRRAASFFRGP